MTSQNYPNNLIRAIYYDPDNDDTHTSTTDIQGLFDMLGTLTDQERQLLELRYRERLTLAACGKAAGVTTSKANTVIRKALNKMRQTSRKKYYQKVDGKVLIHKQPDSPEPNEYPNNLIQDIQKSIPGRKTVSLIALEQAFDTLAPELRKLIELRYEKENTFKECGNVLNMTPQKARAKNQQVLHKLRKALGLYKKIETEKVRSTKPTYDELVMQNNNLKKENLELKTNLTRLVIPWLITEPEKLNTPIGELGLSNGTYNALMRSGIQNVRDALAHASTQFNSVPNFGKNKQQELIAKIHEFIQ